MVILLRHIPLSRTDASAVIGLRMSGFCSWLPSEDRFEYNRVAEYNSVSMVAQEFACGGV